MTLSMTPLSRSGRLAAAALLTGMLAACGGGGGEVTSPPAPPTPAPAPVDPLASFTQQKLDWQTCDPTLLGEGENDITELGERAKCALMRAPLDYANPALGELKVALLRVSAEQPQQRLGAILFNPGGPGGDGLTMGTDFGLLWSTANTADPAGKLLKDMSNRYDMVGFSPRGVGASTTLVCGSSELKQIENNLTFDRSPQNIKSAQHNARLKAQTCAKNPLTKHIHTDATVRDMDLVRSLLGDAKLNFIGYSYGTWLGAWYASVFPERVGRMLLDSSMNVAGTFDDATLLQEMGTQRVMNEVVFPYAARHAPRFNLGTDADQIKSALLALPSPLKAQVMNAVNLANSQNFDANPLSLTAAIGLQAIRQQLPQADKFGISAAIQNYTFTPGPDNAEAARLANKFNDGLFNPPTRRQIVVSPSEATYASVVCNDMATVGNEQRWVDIGNDYASLYPLKGGAATANTCLYWGPPVGTRPPLALAAKAAPLLMVQSRHDALTPIEGAQKTLAALPNASMIVVENEYSHGVFPYGESCVDQKVADYFVNGTVPARTSSCAGKPLPADAAVAPVTPRQRSAPAPAVNTYKDPAEAEQIMRRIHKRIGDANKRGS